MVHKLVSILDKLIGGRTIKDALLFLALLASLVNVVQFQLNSAGVIDSIRESPAKYNTKIRARYEFAIFLGNNYPRSSFLVPRTMLSSDIIGWILTLGRVSRIGIYGREISLNDANYKPFKSPLKRRGDEPFVIATRTEKPVAFIIIKRGGTNFVLDISLLPPDLSKEILQWSKPL